jgi:hypothetical protein
VTAALERALGAARAQLALAKHGELSLGSREVVWAALGPRAATPTPGRPLPGHVLRAEIAFRTCTRGLPLWEVERPGDEAPHQVLAVARLALNDEVSEREAKTAAGRLWGRTENLTQLVGDPHRLWVGFAASKAVDVALYDEVFDGDHPDATRTSFGLDLFELDLAFTISVAVADGAPWEDGSDPGARRAFWTWWLQECVPAVVEARS